MTISPRPDDQIFESIRTRLESRIDSITNFVAGSFNREFLEAYSDQVRESEIKSLAAELGGYVDYAGKTLTQNDLDNLGVENVDPSEINPYMRDEQLDLLAANSSLNRTPGTKARGTVEFQTVDDSATIEDGFTIGTNTEVDGTFQRYYVDAEGDGEITPDSTATVSPNSGQSTLQVEVIAEGRGDAYNTGTNTIEFIPNPTPGIESVTNIEPVDGGTNEQQNESFREDVRNAIFGSSEGGTAPSIKGYIERNASQQVVASTQEYTDECPPYVDVVIDGGDEAELRNLIEICRPVGIRHTLVRPTQIVVGFLTTVEGTGIDTAGVENDGISYIESLRAGEDFSWSKLLNSILTADIDIDSAPALDVYATEVSGRKFYYNDVNDTYTSDFAPLGVMNTEHVYNPDSLNYSTQFGSVDTTTLTVSARVDNVRKELVESTDYTVSTDTNGYATITFTDGVVDDYSLFEFEYTHTDIQITDARTVNGTVLDETNLEFVDADGDGVLDSIEWLQTPPIDAGARISLSYEIKSSIGGDYVLTDQERLASDIDQTNVVEFDR